jgi:hypothetical protein
VAEQSALPGAVAAHERDPVAGLDAQVDAAEDCGAVGDLVPEALELERRGAATRTAAK